MKSIFGGLSYLGMALVFGALAVRVLKPEWDQYAIYATWTGLGLVVLYTLSQWREIADQFKQRNTRYSAIAGVSVLVVLGILVAVNYLSFRRNVRWDLTSNKQYSLSDQSVKLLQGLASPVKFLVFEQETNFENFRTRLNEYAYHSRQVSVEYIDPDKRPVQAREYEIENYGTIVVEYMGRRERLTSNTEQDVTNALIKVLTPQQKKVYFLSGHGEKDTGNTERGGYNAIAEALRRDNYEFAALALSQTNEIPADATVIVIAGPKTDLFDSEVTLLSTYLSSKAGKLLVLLDPSDDLKTPATLPKLTGLIGYWGITATDTVVVDVSGLTNVATMPVAAPPYPTHPITEGFNLVTMFPLARAITPKLPAEEGRAGQSFVQTSQRSWAEQTLSTLETPDALAPEPEKGDLPGPVSVAAAVAVAPPSPKPAEGAAPAPADEKKPETRLAVIGDSDFASNAYLGVQGNRDLFMNTISWLAQQESLISIRPREAADRRLTLTANYLRGIRWMSLFIIPAIILGTGVFAWMRRR